ncbi:kinetochore-associated Ndc80 complex subunit SPC24 [Rhodotorula paludigena]|uniref:kinetochore-associated Ndc80 complex subunit SPC24 n=1 Tax=Rhodotorula paludigena TaxID=86838 RepID=UPI0031757CF0
MSAELAADDFQSQFQELIDGALGLFVVDPSDAHDDAGPNDVEKVLIAEQRVKEWRAQTKHRVDQARDDLRAITREYKQAEVASQRSTALPSTEAHEAKMTTMRQARLAGMKANSELEQQVYHLQGELERLQQELKDEEAEAVDALELNSEVLRIKLYRDMGFLPIEENGIFTKVVVRSQQSRDARTVQLDESTSDYKWSEFLWDLASK